LLAVKYAVAVSDVALSEGRERELADWLGSMPIASTLGAECVSARAGRAELHLHFSPAIAYAPGGGFPASAVGALIDFCGGVAVGTLLPSGVRAATVDFSVKMLAPASGELLIARGKVARQARSLMVSSVEVRDGADAESPCAVGLVTMKVLASA
jgi:acyl-coenzyme A thioesterase PaaI-like protein